MRHSYILYVQAKGAQLRFSCLPLSKCPLPAERSSQEPPATSLSLVRTYIGTSRRGKAVPNSQHATWLSNANKTLHRDEGASRPTNKNSISAPTAGITARDDMRCATVFRSSTRPQVVRAADAEADVSCRFWLAEA